MSVAALQGPVTEWWVAGIDEAGRGPLAGPVVAAAVILHPAQPIPGLDDSKKLSAARRQELAADVRQRALAYAVAWADRAEIDALNILQATMLAMRRAIVGLPVWPRRVLVDGNRLPNLRFNDIDIPGDAVIGGDSSVPSISAASILAKVTRDCMMQRVDRFHPGYGFAQHKGYGTPEHLRGIDRQGPCDAHRRSFRPMRDG